jgi:hypothetical protein
VPLAPLCNHHDPGGCSYCPLPSGHGKGQGVRTDLHPGGFCCDVRGMRLILFRSFRHARGCPAARLSQLAAAASSFDGVELSLRQLTPSVFDACEHASLRISCRLSLRADEEADRQLDQLASVLATHRAAESLLETVIVSSDAAGAGPDATAEGLAELVAHLGAACSSGAQFLTDHPLVGSAHGKRNAHGAPPSHHISGQG